jgi:hypothetical protein
MSKDDLDFLYWWSYSSNEDVERYIIENRLSWQEITTKFVELRDKAKIRAVRWEK